MMADELHKVVVIGGGFGGMYCAEALRSTAVHITLIDRRNFHLFQPLLYQVATGQLSPGNIAAPLRGITSRQKNLRCVLAEVSGFDTDRKMVLTADNDAIPYDTLVLATGSTHSYFGKPEWEQFAPGLKTIEDALEIRRRVLLAFEKAERDPDPSERRRLLTFVVVGGGPTGVEMAGAISELAHGTMRRDFRSVDPNSARVILIEGQPRVIPQFVEKLSAKALRYLDELRVETKLESRVTHVAADHVIMRGANGDGPEERIDTETVVWAAGVQASPLGKMLAEALGEGVQLNRAGQVSVGPDCSVPGHPEIFLVGDIALQIDFKTGEPLAGVAPVAMQQGRYAATVIHHRVRNMAPPKPFNYWNKGIMATIGRSRAVADLGYIRFGGFIAWLAWLFIHIMFLAQFSNRFLVMFQWFWNFVTRGRSARLITGGHLHDRTALLRKKPIAALAEEPSRHGTPDPAPAPAPAAS